MMEDEDDIFLPRHEQLSNISYWAKIASRWVLSISIGYAILIAVGSYFSVLQESQTRSVFSPSGTLPLGNDGFLPYIEIIAGLLYGIMKGIVYYLALKGISLGLDMIVETDINYRAKEKEEETNE